MSNRPIENRELGRNSKEELDMKKQLALVTLLAMAAMPALAQAAGIDWQKVDAALGKPAVVSGDVHRYGLPRSDLKVTLDGVAIKPALALGGWVAFAPMGGEATVMGDLVTSAHIVPRLDGSTGGVSYALTERGKRAVLELSEIMPEERTVRLAYDGLLHRVVDIAPNVRW